MSLPTLIVLTGFMGTGKSSVGRALARLLGYTFTDSDRIIESKEGRSIQKIFETEGEAYFRLREKEIISELVESQQTVLAVGGGAVLNPDTLNLLKQKGFLILLTASAEEIANRLGHENERPLLSEKGNRKKKITELMKQREPIYASIPNKIETTGLAVDEVVEKVLTIF